jgi:gliding motility-associated protein GldE
MRNGIHYIEKKLSVQKGNFSVDQLSQALELTSQSDTTDGEQKILEGIVTFGNTEVRQVMSPRIDVFALNIEHEFKEIMPKIIEKGYSRIPVYKENIDQIEGILFIKDLIPHIDSEDFNWTALLREPFFVPENKKIDDLLYDFQEKRVHMAIVVNEYGETEGLVTMEDIIEEIVGEINDEFDDEEVDYKKLDEQNYLFEAKTSLNDFCRVFDMDISFFEKGKGESETLGGLLIELFGRIPNSNEEISFESFLFRVQSVDTRRIKKIKVTLQQNPTNETA